MKFDVIIGNPPYQEDTEGTSAKQLYSLFMDESFKVADITTFITPAKFLFNAGKTSKKWNKKMLEDPYFKVNEYYASGDEVFPNTSIAGGVAVTTRNKNIKGHPIIIYNANRELQNVISKVVGCKGFVSIQSILHNQTKFILDNLYEDYKELRTVIGSSGRERRLTTNIISLTSHTGLLQNKKTCDNCIAILALDETTKRTKRYINSKYIDYEDIIDEYKVAIPSAGAGTIIRGKKTSVMGKSELIGIKEGCSQTFIMMGGFKTKDESHNALKYTKTKFLRTMLSFLKVTQHNPPSKFKYVPLQDFTEDSDIDWSQTVAEFDQQLYTKYGLTEDEINFIEEHVLPMD